MCLNGETPYLIYGQLTVVNFKSILMNYIDLNKTLTTIQRCKRKTYNRSTAQAYGVGEIPLNGNGTTLLLV